MSPPLACLTASVLGRHYHICKFEKGLRSAAGAVAFCALFRGFRHDRERRACQPTIEKLLQPRTLGDVMHRTIGEAVVAWTRARQFEARMAARGLAMHHRVGHVGMKLE